MKSRVRPIRRLTRSWIRQGPAAATVAIPLDWSDDANLMVEAGPCGSTAKPLAGLCPCIDLVHGSGTFFAIEV